MSCTGNDSHLKWVTFYSFPPPPSVYEEDIFSMIEEEKLEKDDRG